VIASLRKNQLGYPKNRTELNFFWQLNATPILFPKTLSNFELFKAWISIYRVELRLQKAFTDWRSLIEQIGGIKF